MKRITPGAGNRSAWLILCKLFGACAAALVFLLARPAYAQTWVNTTGTNWNSSASWTNPGSVPGASGTAVFSGTEISNPSLTTSATTGELLFSATNSFGYNIGGAAGTTLTLNGATAINALDVGTNTISENLVLGLNQLQTISGTNGTFLVLSGNIAGSGAASGLSFSRTATGNVPVFTLSGSNSYSGGTSLTATVTLNINNNNALGSGALQIATGSGATINNTSGGTITVTNPLFLSNSSNTLTFSGSNNLAFSTGTVTVNGAQTISSGTGILTFGASVVDGAGAGSLTKTGSGTLILSGSNTYSGGTTVSGAGVLVVTSTNGLGNGAGITLSNGNLSLLNNGAGNGGTIVYTGTASGSGYNVTVSTISSINVDNNGSNTGNTIQLNNLTIGGNTLTLTNGDGYNLSFSGTATSSGQTMFANNMTSGTLTLTTLANTTTALTDVFNGTSASGVVDVGTIIQSGTFVFAITQSGAGTLLLAGSNNYTGATTISSGTIALGNAGAVQNTTVTISAANGLAFNNALSGTNTYNLGGLSGASNEALTDVSGSNVNITVGGNNASSTYSGSLSGSGGLVKVGTGTLSLSGSNALTGGVTILSGTLAAGAVNSLGNTGSKVLLGDPNAADGNPNATLGLNGNAITYANTSVTTQASGTGTLTIADSDTNNGSVTFGGAIILTNTNTLNITYADPNNGGSANFFMTGGISGTGNVILNESGNAGHNLSVTTGTLNFVGTLTGAGTFAIGTTVSSVIGSNVTNVIENSAVSPLVISANNSYSGSTNILVGILEPTVNGALSTGTVFLGSTSGAANAALDPNSTSNFSLSNNIVAQAGTSGGITIDNITGTGNEAVTLSGGITLGSSGTGQSIALTTANTAGAILTLSGVIADAAGIAAGTGGTVTIGTGASSTSIINITGSNTYTGNTILNTANLFVGQGAGAQSLGSGTLTINSGAIGVFGAGNATLNNNSVWAGNFGGPNAGGNVTLAGSVALTGSRTISLVNSSITVGTLGGGNGVIADSGGSNFGLTVTGATVTGTLTLNGSNTFDGGVTLVSNGVGTLRLNIGNLGTTSGASALGTGTFTIGSAAAVGTISINNTSGANGTLSTNNAEVWNNDFTFAGTNNLDIGAGAVSLGTLSGTNRTVTVSGGTFEVDGSISNGSNAAPVTGLIKAGAGTLVLGGSNAYTGVTNFSAGELNVGNINALANSGTLTFTGGSLQYSGSNQIDYTSKIANSTGAISIDTNGQTVTYAGSLVSSNSGGLTKLGAGTLNLSASNAYTGTTTVSNGTLNLTGTLGGSPTVTVNGGTLSLQSAGGLAIANTVTVSGSGNLAETVANALSGTTALTVNGGIATLSQSNNDSGATTLTTGTLYLDTAGALASSTSLALNGGTLDNNSAGAVTLSSTTPITIGGNFTYGGTQNLNLGPGAVSDTGNRTITLSGSAVLTLGGTMTNTSVAAQTTTVNGAGNTLVLAGGYVLSGTSTTNVTDVFNGSGNVTINGPVTSGSSAASALSYTGSGVLTLNGTDTYNGLTTLNSTTGALTLSGSNTGTGGVTLTAGKLSVNSSNALGTGTLILTSGTIDNTSGGLITNAGNNPITINGSIAFGGSNNLNLGSGAVALTPVKVITLNGTNSVLTASGTWNNATDATQILVTVNGPGNTLVMGALNLDNAGITSRTQSILGNGKVTITGPVANGSSTASQSLTINGPFVDLTGTNTYTGLTTVSSGTLQLDGINTADGGTTVTGGVLALGSGGNGGLAGGTLTVGAGTVQAEGNTLVTSTNNVNFSPNGSIAVFGAAQGATSGTGNLTFSNIGAATASGGGNGAITVTNSTVVTLSTGSLSTNAFTKNGTGTLVLNNIVYSDGNPFTVNAGLLQLSGTTNLLGNAGATLVVNGGVLDLNGLNQQTKTLSGTGGVILNNNSGTTATLTIGVGNNAGTQTYSGTIANNNNAGTGVVAVAMDSLSPTAVILTGVNTYTGATTIMSTGTLQIGNGVTGSLSSSGTITLSAAGVLALDEANGSTQGNTIVNSAGTVVGLEAVNTTNTLSGNISGGGGFTQNGAGVTILAGSNSYSGGTTINSGTLQVNTSTPVVQTSALTFNGGVLGVSGTQTYGSLVVNANTTNTIVLGGTTTLTITSATQSFGSNSLLTLNSTAGGANATSATLGNALMIWTTGTVGSVINPDFLVTDNGGTGFATTNSSNDVIRQSVVLLPDAGAVATNAYLINNNNGGPTAPGSSTLTLIASEAASSITVDTSLASGTLNLGGNTLSTDYWLLSSSNANTNTYAITSGTLKSVASGDSIAFDNTNQGALTIAAPIVANGANAVTFNGAGTTILSASNTYTGLTTVTAGTLQLGVANAINTAANVSVASGAAFDLAGNSQTVAALANSGTITSSSGTANLVNNFPGAFTTEGGTGNFTTGSNAVLNVTVNAASSNQNAIFSGAWTNTGNITLNQNNGSSGALLQLTGGVNNTGTITNSGSGPGAVTLSGSFGGNITGIIQNSGSSTLSITGINNTPLTAAISILGGTLSANGGAGNTNQLGTGSIVLGATSGNLAATLQLSNVGGGATVNNAITVQAGSAGTDSIDYNAGASTGTVGGAITLANNLTLVSATSGATLAVTGGFTGTGNLTLTGAGATTVSSNGLNYTGSLTDNDSGTVTLNTVNSYAGATTINAGILNLATGTAAAASSNFTVDEQGTLDFSSNTAGNTGTTRVSSLTLSDAKLSVLGNATANSVDTITNALTITSSATTGGGLDIVSLTANAAKNTQLTAASLVETNGGVVEFSGTNLGANTSASNTANSTNITFASAPTAALVGGGGAAGSTNISIIPWALGDGNPAGSGTTFVTYTAANGIRPLNTSTEYDTSITGGTVNQDNVMLTATNGNTFTVNGNTTINSLLILNSSSNGATLTGAGSLTITSGALFDNYTAQTFTVTKQLNFGGVQAFIGSATGANQSLALNGGISGSGGVTFYDNSLGAVGGDGGITLSVATTYTGTTTILGGITADATGVLPGGNRTGDVYLYGRLDNNIASAASTTINGLYGNGLITHGHSQSGSIFAVGDNNANGNFTGSMTNFGSMILSKIGSGTQILSGDIGLYGVTNVNGGTLLLDFSATGAPTANILYNILNGGDSAVALGGGALSLKGSATSANSQTTYGLTINAGASAIVLNANATTPNSLVLNTSGTSGNNVLTRNAGGTVDFTLPTGTQNATNGVLTSSTTFLANNILASAATNGVAFATVGGADWASLSGSNIVGYSTVGSYSSSYTSGANNVNVTNGDTFATSGTVNTLRFNSATDALTLSGTDTIGSGGILVTAAATNASITTGTISGGTGKELVIIDNGALTINSSIGNNGTATALTISGSGATTLTGSNTYTGQNYINGSGVTVISRDANLGLVTTGATVNINGGTLMTGGSMALDNNGANKRAVVIGNNGATFDVASSGTLTISGVVSGGVAGITTALTKIDTGVLNLTGANTYVGDTIIDAGTVNFNTAAAAGSAQSLGESTLMYLGAANSTATMQYTGAASGTFGQNITVTGTGIISNSGGATLTVAGNVTKTDAVLDFSGGSFNVTGVITGASGAFDSDLNVMNGSTVVLSTTNSYFGPTTVSGSSTLQNGAGVANALPVSTILTLGASTDAASAVNTYDLNGNSQSIAGLASSGSGSQIVTTSSNNGANTLTITGTNVTETYGGVIQNGSGNVALTVSGGTQVLTGANTYTGATSITGGTLTVARAGTAGNANGGTLAGTAITVNTGGTLLVSASNALGTNSSVTLNGGTFNVSGNSSEGTATSVGRGTGPFNANVQGMGNLTLTAASTLDFGVGSTSTQVFGSFTDASNAILTIADYVSSSNINLGQSGVDGTDDRLIFDVAGGLTTQQLADISFGAGTTAGQINLGGNFYEVSVVPEPTTIFAGLLLVGFLGLRERRRLSELYRRVAAKKA